MKTISVNLPEAFVEGLETLVKRGLYANRSEAIRVSVRDLLKRELIEPISYSGIREKEESPFGKVEDSVFSDIIMHPCISFLIYPSIPKIGPLNSSQFELNSLFSFFVSEALN